MSLLDTMRPVVDAKVDDLARREFAPDPIAGALFSRVVSVISSAYKRQGPIIESSIVECLRSNERYEVWGVDRFGVQQQASTIVATADNDPDSLSESHLDYVGDGQGDNHIQIDAVVYDKETRIVSAYEIKRGHGHFDSGKQRSMKRDALLVKVLLRDHCRQRGFPAQDSRAHIVFYYGLRSVPAPMGLIGEELDEHFGMEVWGPVEEVNKYYRTKLFEILSQ